MKFFRIILILFLITFSEINLSKIKNQLTSKTVFKIPTKTDENKPGKKKNFDFIFDKDVLHVIKNIN
jgi:hypothetical protein